MRDNDGNYWSIRHFLFSPGGVISMSIVSLVLAVMWGFSDREIFIVEVQINDSAVVRVYKDNFCDQSFSPRFEVLVEGKQISPRIIGPGWFMTCEFEFDPDAFRIVHAEHDSLHGVYYDFGRDGESLGVVFDSKIQKCFPNENDDLIPIYYEKVLDEIAVRTRKNRTR